MKLIDMLELGSPESVDGLSRVTHTEEPLHLGWEMMKNAELKRVGVLHFVHKNFVVKGCNGFSELGFRVRAE